MITQLFTYLEGNATLLEIVYALTLGNEHYLQTLNASCITQFDRITDIIDQVEISVGDTDYEKLSDLEELSYGTSTVLMDTDCDNLNDGFEIKIGTDPLDEDTDNDDFLDGIEMLPGTDPNDALDFSRSTPSSTTTTTTTTTLIKGEKPPDSGFFIGLEAPHAEFHCSC